MNTQHILILGAGISGLSCAWYLSRKHPGIKITILEKNARAGGWIQTDHTTGFHFEKGPRAFMAKKATATLQLIEELGMTPEVIWTEGSLHARYLWFKQRLHALPKSLTGFLLSPLTRDLIPSLLTEWFRPAHRGDETVWDFAARRFGKKAADRLFDPLVVGIFGGDARQISIQSCFPQLKEWEEEYGSVTKGLFHMVGSKKDPSCNTLQMPRSAFFSFRTGMSALIDQLSAQVPAEIVYGSDVNAVQFDGKTWVVGTQDHTWKADALISALPATQTAHLFDPLVPELTQVLHQVRSLGFTLINAGYEKCVLPLQGFGYLTQTTSQEAILGAVFDSSVFPEHNHTEQETRITIKLADQCISEEEAIQKGLEGIRTHTGLDARPDVLSVTRTEGAIPQYAPFHLENMAEVQRRLAERLPSCRWVGNYLAGVSVDQCIAHAKKVVENW